MEKNEIDFYLYNILKKQLQKFRVSSYGLYSTLKNVNKQLNSIIKHWNDKEFLDIIFLTTMEEGNFYEPMVNKHIGNLIVLGVRNSLLEIIASNDYKSFGLKKNIKDSDIKEITSTAIEYFKNIDLEKLSSKITTEDDYYYDTIQKYKISYQVLSKLSKCSIDQLEIEFPPIKCEPYFINEIYSSNDKGTTLKVREVMSGISEKIDQSLLSLLKGILEEKASFFYVDSFKYLSRNFDKNLKILEFILTHNGIFLTNNYFISNGYVSRRKELIRANHGDDFNFEAINSIENISEKYKDELKKNFLVR